ncbi:MAG: hypothetical protein EPN25_06485 [Nitrospirae bacterium]|nr:MAG: hypothetical protein EPN25_06485 [Nitrospirota bacterium]
MKKWFGFLCLSVFVLTMQGAAIAVITDDLNTTVPVPITAQSLADTVFGLGGATVSATAVHTGDPSAAGLFSGGVADGLGVEEGVILSTGDIFNAELTPNTDTLIGTSFNLAGDANVSAVLQGKITRDASVLEFDFVPNPNQNVVDFNFVFASDEYNENTDGGIYGNDALVLLVDGVNFALVPGTGTPVSIDAINLNVNPLFFNNNDPNQFPDPTQPFATQFDGFTTALTSRVIVKPGQSYHVKIAIADDAGTFNPADPLDDFVDSAVFVAPAVVQSLPVNTVGIFRSGEWYLDINGNSAWDGTAVDRLNVFGVGLTGAVPVTGDWDHTGVTKMGIFHDGVWYLDMNGNGAWDGEPTDRRLVFGVGLVGAIPVTGDWTGFGTTFIGIFHNGVWYLDMNGNGAWDGTSTDAMLSFGAGLTGAVPVIGNWTGLSATNIGIFHDGVWYLDLNGNGAWDGAPADGMYTFGVGLPGAVPVTGDWNGSGSKKIGIFLDGTWYLDYNGNGAWDGGVTDRMSVFGAGLTGIVPVTGKWN